MLLRLIKRKKFKNQNQIYTQPVTTNNSSIRIAYDIIEKFTHDTPISTQGTISEDGFGFKLTLVSQLLDEAGGRKSDYHNLAVIFQISYYII